MSLVPAGTGSVMDRQGGDARTPALWLMIITGTICGFVIPSFMFHMPAAVSLAGLEATLTFFGFGTGGTRPL